MNATREFSREDLLRAADEMRASLSPHNALHLLQMALGQLIAARHAGAGAWPDEAIRNVHEAMTHIRAATGAEPIPAEDLDPVTLLRRK